jgi:hypothetical protein
MLRGLRVPAAILASAGAAIVIGNIAAFAYASGSVGYDISFPQCGAPYPNVLRLGGPTTRASNWVLQNAVHQAPAAPLQSRTVGGSWWSVPRQNPPSGGSSSIRSWYRVATKFGIVGVDGGHPFISAATPGNPCLADEYVHTYSPGLYINTGFDPIYTDSSHTTPDCTSRSGTVAGTPGQKAAWAAGCSEAEGDLAYVAGKNIANPAGWWLDVETGNSWCGLHGVTCDGSLNQYAIQGIIDTLLVNHAAPVGIYSNTTQWSQIVGTLPVTGATSDWVASGTSTVQQAATYCSPSQSFSAVPVSLVQFLPGSIDRDYAC